MGVKRVFLLTVLLFSACSSQMPATPISTSVSTETSVPSATSTMNPTQTATIVPSPTSTRVPPNPKNLSYKVVGDIPQFEIDSYLRGVAIMQDYLCSVYQLCEFKPVTLLIGNTGYGCGADDITGGTLIYMHVSDCGLVNPTELQFIGGAAGESAIAYTIQQQGCMTNTGQLKIPPYWSEGANAYYREQSLIWAGETANTQDLTPKEWIYRRYVREAPYWNVDQLFQMDNPPPNENNRVNWWHRIVVGYVMFEYLDQHPELITVMPEPGEPKLLVTRLCKALLKTGSLDAAFQSVGIDRQDLYARLVEHMAAECAKPDIVCDGEAEPASIGGDIAWSSSFDHQDFSKYTISFCPSKGGDCFENIPIQSDGTFFQLLPSGSFQVGLNSAVDGVSIGWYSKSGMVTDQGCADSIYVGENKNVKIDFYIVPIQCVK